MSSHPEAPPADPTAGPTPKPESHGSAWLAEHDVPTIHLSIAIAPLSVECDAVHVITDPAQALDHIAADTVAGAPRPHTGATRNTLPLKGHRSHPQPQPRVAAFPRPV